MITHISHTLAQQIVNTIKDVCSYDINFINPSGTIIASTNDARIGAFHEIGRKAAVTGTTIEVAESDNFTGTRQGINLPLYQKTLSSGCDRDHRFPGKSTQVRLSGTAYHQPSDP